MNSKMATEKRSSGNTKRTAPSKRWCFTIHNYTDQTIEWLQNFFRERGDKYIFGCEVGSKTEKDHLQGYVEFNKGCRPIECKELKILKGHWEKCGGTPEENIQYCSKESGKIYYWGISPMYPVKDKVVKEKDLYPWQKNLVDMLRKKPDKRTIIWVHEKTGNVGKSTLVDFLIYELGAIILEGKNDNVLFCAAQYQSSLYVYDIPRANLGHVSYAAIEKIKNGTYMCSKYESKPILRCNPHVIIFANEPPDTEKLSNDRWEIFTIKEKNLVKQNKITFYSEYEFDLED